MVELLWRLIVKVNARAVFLFTVLLLSVTLVFLFRKGALFGRDLSLVGHRVPPAPRLLVDETPHDVTLSTQGIDDPFTSAFLMAWLDLEASRQRERDAAKAAAAIKVTPVPETQPQPPVVVVPPKVEPQWISVKYQGMVARTDGSRVALVAEVDGGALHTLEVGDTWLVYRIESISSGRVVLACLSGDEAEGLTAGVVCRVMKGEL